MASTREWFETVEEARKAGGGGCRGRRSMALVAGAEKGVTLR